MRTRVLFVGGLLLALLAATLTGAAAARTNATSAKATPKAIDLATYPAKRWIVMLDKKPLARYSAREARAQPRRRESGQAESRRGRQPHLSSRARPQPSGVQDPADTGREGLPRGALVQPDPERPRGQDEPRAGRQGPAHEGRSRGHAGRPVPTSTCTRRRRRSARPRCGSRSAARRNAGRGVKVAVIDSGIFVTKDAAGNYTGNPCFNDAGYTAPSGLPEGRHALHEQQGDRRAGVLPARATRRRRATTRRSRAPGARARTARTSPARSRATRTRSSASAPLTISGVAPRAYLMNYRVFYPIRATGGLPERQRLHRRARPGDRGRGQGRRRRVSATPGARATRTRSRGPTRWSRRPRRPSTQASWASAHRATAARDTATGNLPSASDKVIAVGAVTKDAAHLPGLVNVTAPTPVPANLTNLPIAGAANFGPSDGRATIGPAAYMPARRSARPRTTRRSAARCRATSARSRPAR